jgi:hypothetical protein
MLAAAVGAAAEEDTSRFLQESIARELSAQGTIVQIHKGDVTPLLMPAVEASADIRGELAGFHPAVSVEILRLFHDAPMDLGAPQGILSLFNIMASVSTMKGITYWSASRNKTWTLFTESYAIESPDKPVRIPDRVFRYPLVDSMIYSFQEDTSFGKNTYQTLLSRKTDCIWSRTENMGPITYLFVRIIPERGLINHTLLIPMKNGLLFYGIALLKTSFSMGDPASRAESLKNRVIAMSDWLWGRLTP